MSRARLKGAFLHLFLASLSCLSAARAAAETALPAAARILISGCSTRFNERALQDHVRVELLAAGVSRVRTVELYSDDIALEEEPASLATLRVTFPDCEENADEIRLSVADRKTGRHLERALVISDVPDVMQARAIGLALTELLRAQWAMLSQAESETEQAVDSERPPRAPKLLASQIVQETAARDAREVEIAQRLRIEWLAVGRLYPQTDSGDLSTSLSLSKLFSQRARMQVGGSVAGGAGQGTDARLFLATGRLLVALCSRTLNPGIEVGALFEAGWASLDGIRDGKRNGGIVSAGAHATLRVPAAEMMEALITVQAGYVLVPMTTNALTDTGETPRRLGFSGPTLGIGVGLASML